MAAYAFLAEKRALRDRYYMLGLLNLGSSGDDKALKKQFDTWDKEL
jgi:hypothetical protein